MDVVLDPYFFDDVGHFVYVYPESQSDTVAGSGPTGLETVPLGVGDREQYDVFASVYNDSSSSVGQ